MARKITLLCCLLLAALLPSAVLRVNPSAPAKLSLQPGIPLRANPPFPAPKNVNITLWPSDQNPDSVKVSWDPVDGAIEYHVYTAIAVPDSSLLIPVIEPQIVDGILYWVYLYSKHPIYGDVAFRRLHSKSADIISYCYGLGEGSIPKFSPWTLADVGRFDGCSFFYPMNADRDRVFHVRAVR